MKTERYGTILMALLAVLAVAGLILIWPQAPLDSALASPAAPRALLVCHGYVDSLQGPLLLLPARAGRVMQVLVKEKQKVYKDTPLVQLDDGPVQVQEQQAMLAIDAAQLELTRARNGLKQYQARQAQEEAALEAASVKLQTAEHYLAVTEQMQKDGLAGKGRLDLIRDQRNEARALLKAEQNKLTELRALDPELEVRLAQVQRERAQAQLRHVRQEHEEYVLKAPVDGTILRVYSQEGDLVSPNSPRPAIWLSPGGPWIVRAEVSQEFAGRVQQGLRVQVEDEANARLLARGWVGEVSDWFLPRRQFSPQPTSINTGATMECIINLDEDHSPLRLGQRVRVRVLADQPAGIQSTTSLSETAKRQTSVSP